MFYNRDKTRVQLFYFDSNTTLPRQCAALVFLESVCLLDVVWLTVPWDTNNISFQTLIKLTASRSMKAFRYFNDARFNFHKDDVFCITKHLLNVSIFRFISFGLASSNCKLQYQRQKLSVAVLGQKRPKY